MGVMAAMIDVPGGVLRMGSEEFYPEEGPVHERAVAAFALGDYECLLPLEADDDVELVDLMRDLRATEARRHVREEVPFFTGRRIGTDEVAEVVS